MSLVQLALAYIALQLVGMATVLWLVTRESTVD